jgi:hypothetical protein
MHHAGESEPGDARRQGVWQASPNPQASRRSGTNFLEMSETHFHNTGWGRLMVSWSAARRPGCQSYRLGEKASTRPRQGRRSLMLEAATCSEGHLPDRSGDQTSPRSATLAGELIAKKTLACLLRTSRLGEKTFTRHALCTLRLHPSCIGRRSITLNNGATDAAGR